MPSAANVKIDKQINSDTALADFSGNPSGSPLRQAITIIEHKIRNLEKRKAKLESYRELQASGKDLNQDQKTAVAKYEEVVQTLEFARDLCKQFLGIAAVSEKESRKQARKEAAAKSQAELAKIREVLLVQDALNQMGQDTIREDFLVGRNGAANLTEADLKLLDDLYPAVTPKHEPGDATSFANQVQAAAEHLLAVVDGKQKEIFSGSYSQIKEVIGKIHESGYLDQAATSFGDNTTATESEQLNNNNSVPATEIHPQALQEMLPTLDMVTIEPARQTQLEPSSEQLPPPEQQQLYYQQPPPPPRPITDVIGGGSFFFLQDSELDTPDTLPSQTFTNTSYVQAPPPPIPLPPNFQTYNQQSNNPAVIPPPGNGIEEPGLSQQQQQQQQQQQAMQSQTQAQPQLHQSQHKHAQSEETQKHRGQTRPNQNYYQNNSNNYNGRPRQHRNGPRTGNRHQ